MTIRGVVPNIPSSRVDDSRQFYVDFLGFEVAMDLGFIVTFKSPGNPTAQISVVSSDGALAAHPHPSLTVEIAEVDEVHARAVARQLEIVYPLTDEAWGVRRFGVADPNGIILNVMSHLPPKSATK